jgi:hypothetical protein
MPGRTYAHKPHNNVKKEYQGSQAPTHNPGLPIRLCPGWLLPQGITGVAQEKQRRHSWHPCTPLGCPKGLGRAACSQGAVEGAGQRDMQCTQPGPTLLANIAPHPTPPHPVGHCTAPHCYPYHSMGPAMCLPKALLSHHAPPHQSAIARTAHSTSSHHPRTCQTLWGGSPCPAARTAAPPPAARHRSPPPPLAAAAAPQPPHLHRGRPTAIPCLRSISGRRGSRARLKAHPSLGGLARERPCHAHDIASCSCTAATSSAPGQGNRRARRSRACCRVRSIRGAHNNSMLLRLALPEAESAAGTPAVPSLAGRAVAGLPTHCSARTR